MRGNRSRPGRLPRRRGSIPARAGEPEPCEDGQPALPVYPRACGGTFRRCRRSQRRWGLSPRVRGNRDKAKHHAQDNRSIPARAGEPHCSVAMSRQRKVYPRACGGTLPPLPLPGAAGGLSPRVRGNRLHHVRQFRGHRSIPARAGEPRRKWPGRRRRTVYPRACGGTSSAGCPPDGRRGVYPRACGGTLPGIGDVGAGRGLSPRVRGNQFRGVSA